MEKIKIFTYKNRSVCILLVIFFLVACTKASHGDAISGNVWIEDYSQALTMAQESNKSVLINFTGSDWCYWCMRLDEEVFSQPDFISFAEKNLILLKIDFPNNI